MAKTYSLEKIYNCNYAKDDGSAPTLEIKFTPDTRGARFHVESNRPGYLNYFHTLREAVDYVNRAAKLIR